MKKKLLVLVILMFSVIPLSATTIYLDGAGSYVGAGDAKSQLGFSAGFGYQLNYNINFLFRFKQSSITTDIDLSTETENKHMAFYSGIEYRYLVSDSFRFSIAGGSYLGYSETEIYPKSDNERRDEGLSVQPFVSFIYDFSQRISTYLEVGYHKSIYWGDLEDKNIGGATASLGVKLSIWGTNHNLNEMY